MKGGRPMSVSVEIFVGVQAVSGFCLLVALSHLTARGRPPYGRLGLCALGAAGMTLLLLCFGNPSAAGLGAVMMNLLVPFAALGNLPRMRRVRAAGAYLLLNLLLEGCLRVLYSAGLPALPAVLLASAVTLLLPGLGQRMRPLPVTRVEVRWRGRSVCLSALVDSGNLLRDGITGLPVVVCSQLPSSVVSSWVKNACTCSSGVLSAAGSRLSRTLTCKNAPLPGRYISPMLVSSSILYISPLSVTL